MAIKARARVYTNAKGDKGVQIAFPLDDAKSVLDGLKGAKEGSAAATVRDSLAAAVKGA